MNRPKKRLELMPEVLPVPTRQTAANPSVRSRTLGHMHRMIAAAGAVAGCTRAVTQGDSTITIAPTASTSAAPTPTPAPIPTPPSSTGFMVVDMLPSPARCFGVAASMSATGTWQSDSSGLFLEIRVMRSTAGGATTTLDSKTVSAWGGTLMSATGTPAQVVIRIRPLPGNTYVGASIEVGCGPKDGALTGTIIAGVNLPSARKAGDLTPVTLMDR